MSIIKNLITKILSNDENDSFSILTYIDFEEELSSEYIINYVNTIINDNPILKQNIIKENDVFTFQDIENFNVDDIMNIKYIEKEKFDNFINDMLNTKFIHNTFFVVCCIDKEKKVSRIYFKINHSHADGYKLINILTKPFLKKNYIPEFKRKTSIFKSIYHWIIGTIVLLVMNIKIFFKLLFNNKNDNIQNDNETDHIICNPLMLDKIKQICLKNGITINDFLYSLMIKTDKLYVKKNRNIKTCFPINVSKLTSTNNLCPIFNSINNYLNDSDLFEEVHNKFDHFKYSLFIPFLTFFMNNFLSYINSNILSILYDSLTCDVDYIYSNIIGPPVKEINKETNLNLKNISFLIKSKGNGIIFNIISYENKINIICSFKKNKIKDKKRFENCIYEAYETLITDDIGFN